MNIPDFYMSEKANSRNFLFGCIFLVLGLVSVFATKYGGTQIIVGILFIILFNIQKKNPLVRFKDKHLEVKLAPLASKNFVSYKDIISITKPTDKVLELVYLNGAKDKKLKFHLSLLTPHEGERLLGLLKNRVKDGE